MCIRGRDVIAAEDALPRAGIFSFIDAFDVHRKSAADWQELAGRGVRRGFIGMESGAGTTVGFLRQPGATADGVGAGGRSHGGGEWGPPCGWGLGRGDRPLRVEGAARAVPRGEGPADVALAAGPGIRRLIAGELAPDRAISSGVVEVLHGRGELLARFANTFHLAA